jgi:cytoskeleton protein RodZ
MMGLGLVLGVAAVFWFLQQPANPELALPEVDTPPVVDLPVASAVVEATPQPASAASSVAVVSAASVVATANPSAEPASAVAVVSTDAIKVTSSTDSWVQIVDANGNKVLSEIVRPGVERTVDGKPPFAVKVGNAPKTQLYFHGQNVDLGPYLKPGSDVVNLELK